MLRRRARAHRQDLRGPRDLSLSSGSVAPRVYADLALLAASLVWGLAFFFQKAAMAHIGPLAFIAARSVAAALALAPLAAREQRRSGARVEAGFVGHAAGGGASFFAGACLQQTGLQTATITNAGFLTALYVVVTPFVAWTWSGKRPNPLVWPAMLLSALGTWLLGGGGLSPLSFGDGLVALSALFWAVHVVITGQVARYRRPFTYTALVFATVTLLATPCSALLETTAPRALIAAAVDIAYVGFLSSALAFTVLTFALEHAPPAEAAVISSTETLFAALAGYVLLGERLPRLNWAGAALILLGTLAITLGPLPLAASRRRDP